MQTLWARVAQVKGSCRCPQCLSHQANAVSRRATATATRRAPKYLTSSTLWYSGIFAAAATFDAGVKKQRREQWENAIADVKQELEQPGSTAVQVGGTETREDDDIVRLILGGRDGREDVFRDVDPQRSKPFWPTNTGAALYVHHLPPESVYATEERHARSEKTALSPKKVAAIQLAVEKLQLEIFLELERRGWSEDASKVVPDDFAKHILASRDELERLLTVKTMARLALARADASLSDYLAPSDDVNFCDYTHDQRSQTQRAIHNLNQSQQKLFNLYERRIITRPALLAKIAYNLSVCPAPPNLRTFNTLLLGFSRIDECSLVDRLIPYIRQAHMRPNEVTLAAILRHYTKSGQAESFVRWIEYMRGINGGLALARPGIVVNEAGKSRLIAKEGRPDKIIQLPYATPYVFGAVIEGVIKFAGFEVALSVCQNMGSEGWGLCMSGLTPLLQACAERADWESGLAVWNQILTLKANSQRKEGTLSKTERIELDTFAAMLRLCSRCEQKDRFSNVWHRALRAHKGSKDRLVQLLKTESQSSDVNAEHRRDASYDIEHGAIVSEAAQIIVTAEEHPKAEASLHLERADEREISEHDATESAHDTVQKDSRRAHDPLSHVADAHWIRISDPDSFWNRQGNLRWVRSEALQPASSNVQLAEEQLYGLMPAGDDLDEYEIGERPMASS